MKERQQPVDDLGILPDDHLWRGISRNLQPPCVYDEALQRWRPSSVVFEKSRKDKKISVWIKAEVERSKREAVHLMNGVWIGLTQVTARQVRSHDLGIERDSRTEEPAHANIFDKESSRTRSQWREVKESLAKEAEWVIRPEGCK